MRAQWPVQKEWRRGRGCASMRLRRTWPHRYRRVAKSVGHAVNFNDTDSPAFLYLSLSLCLYIGLSLFLPFQLSLLLPIDRVADAKTIFYDGPKTKEGRNSVHK